MLSSIQISAQLHQNWLRNCTFQSRSSSINNFAIFSPDSCTIHFKLCMQILLYTVHLVCNNCANCTTASSKQILHSWSSFSNPLAIHAFLNIVNTWPFQVLRCSQLFLPSNIVKRSHKKNCSPFDSDTKYILLITLAHCLGCHDLTLAFQV